jgi:hypothetical protein
MKQISKSDLYKAITHLVTIKWDFDMNHLQTIMDYFHEELVQEYNQENADTRWWEEYDWSDFNSKFDQRAVDRITYLFQQ